MKVFVAGATGVLGRPTVKALVEAGHTVRAPAPGAEKTGVLRSLGAVARSARSARPLASAKRAAVASPFVSAHSTHPTPSPHLTRSASLDAGCSRCLAGAPATRHRYMSTMRP